VTVAEGETVAGIGFAMQRSRGRLDRPPIEMSMRLLPPEISAYEPLIARVALTNPTDEALSLTDSAPQLARSGARPEATSLP